VEREPKSITPTGSEIVYIWMGNKTLTELTKQYRILISYESEGQRLDIKTISVKMKEEGMSNLIIEEKPPI
jgi:hypothetical protein